jgi:hypothetical protein
MCVLGVSVCGEICTMSGWFLSSIQPTGKDVQEVKKIRNSIQHIFEPGLHEFFRDHPISDVFSYTRSIFHLLGYIGIVVVYWALFTLYVCPVCGTRYVCPGGQMAIKIRENLNQMNKDK